MADGSRRKTGAKTDKATARVARTAKPSQPPSKPKVTAPRKGRKTATKGQEKISGHQRRAARASSPPPRKATKQEHVPDGLHDHDDSDDGPAHDQAETTHAPRKGKAPDNQALAAMLEEVARTLERGHANPYRIRAYRRAAKSIGRQPRQLSALVAAGQSLTSLPDIGVHLEELLLELIRTGVVPTLKDKPGKEHHRAGRTRQGQFIRPLLRPLADALAADLQQTPGVLDAHAAGTYRRLDDTVDSLEIVVHCKDPAATRERWTTNLALPSTVSKDGTRVDLRTQDHLPVTVQFADRPGPALVELTGSSNHVAQLRARAKGKGLAWPPPKAQTEEDIYESLGLPFVPPELREGKDELERAAKGTLPRLVELTDLKGDLHMHTDATDGSASIETMARKSRARGLSYVAITDHTQRTSIAGGLTPDEMRVHLRRIAHEADRAWEEGWGIDVLKGAEVDILRGGLDLPDDVLDELDVVVCSLHHRDRQEGKELTRRVLQAMDHPKAHILGHPTGRMIGRRPAMDLDWGKVFDHAADHGWALEVDGQAYRMDLPVPLIQQAAILDIPFSLSSDAHSVREMQFQQNATEQARRAGLTKEQVINAGTLRQMKARLRRA